MPQNAFQHNIPMLRSLFKGREDVFAVRWEKGNRSGYMPAYQYDPHHYRMHKIKGGTFRNYYHKGYLSLTENEIQKHLDGIQQIGIYPLLTDLLNPSLINGIFYLKLKRFPQTYWTVCIPRLQKKVVPQYR